MGTWYVEANSLQKYHIHLDSRRENKRDIPIKLSISKSNAGWICLLDEAIKTMNSGTIRFLTPEETIEIKNALKALLLLMP